MADDKQKNPWEMDWHQAPQQGAGAAAAPAKDNQKPWEKNWTPPVSKTPAVPEVNPETSPQRFNPIPSSVPFVGRPESIPHAPALETATHLAGEAGKGLYDLGAGLYGGAKDLLFNEGVNPKTGKEEYGAGGLIGMTSEGFHPLDRATHLAGKYIFEPGTQEFIKAREAAEKGHYSEAAGHGLATAVPLIGPWAAGLGEQAGTGDIEGATTRGGVQVIAPKILSKVPPVVGAGAKVLKNIPNAYEGLKTLGEVGKLSEEGRAAGKEVGSRLIDQNPAPKAPIVPPEPPVSQGTPAPRAPRGPRPIGPVTMAAPEAPLERPIGGVSPEAQFQNSFGPEEAHVRGQALWDTGNEHGNFPSPPSEELPTPVNVPPEMPERPFARPQATAETPLERSTPESPAWRTKETMSDLEKAQDRQFIHVSGEAINDAIGDNRELKTAVKKMGAADISRAYKKLMGDDADFGKGAGRDARQKHFKAMLDAGHNPQEIVDAGRNAEPKPAGKS